MATAQLKNLLFFVASCNNALNQVHFIINILYTLHHIKWLYLDVCFSINFQHHHENINIYNYVSSTGQGSFVIPGVILNVRFVNSTMIVFWCSGATFSPHQPCLWSESGACNLQLINNSTENYYKITTFTMNEQDCSWTLREVTPIGLAFKRYKYCIIIILHEDINKSWKTGRHKW